MWKIIRVISVLFILGGLISAFQGEGTDWLLLIIFVALAYIANRKIKKKNNPKSNAITEPTTSLAKVDLDFNEEFEEEDYPVDNSEDWGIAEKNRNINPELQEIIRKIVMLSYLGYGKLPSSNEEFPRYLYYNHGIKYPLKFSYQLIHDGYIEKASLKESLSKCYTIPQLKELAVEENIPVKGKKGDIVEVLSVNLSEEKKREILNLSNRVQLTHKSIELLENYDWIVKLDKNNRFRIDFNEYYEEMQTLPINSSFYDIVWSILSKRTKNYISEPLTISFNEENKFDVLVEQGKSREAMQFAVNMIFFGLTGDISSKIIGFPGLGPRIYNQYIEFIERNKDFYDESMVDTAFMEFPIYAKHVDLTKKEVKSIINECISMEFADYDYVLEKHLN